MKMTGNRYQELAGRTMNDELNSVEQERHALFGMCSEIGEIQGIFQKEYQGHEINYEHLKKELGDLLWFVAEFCTANRWDLEDVMELNIMKLNGRFPKGFEAERSLNRKEGDI
ncbi:MAG: nucleoside triphosphate pyrophosphohydrolase family protein [Eubacteriales bacterium]|nr:nucleoside triphosphate pyrophosphohydrolase family protein [Eubacteriales bacterium]